MAGPFGCRPKPNGKKQHEETSYILWIMIMTGLMKTTYIKWMRYHISQDLIAHMESERCILVSSSGQAAYIKTTLIELKTVAKIQMIVDCALCEVESMTNTSVANLATLALDGILPGAQLSWDLEYVFHRLTTS